MRHGASASARKKKRLSAHHVVEIKDEPLIDDELEIVEMDEQFWAKKQAENEAAAARGRDEVAGGTYDADFFNDEGGGGDMLPPGIDDDDEYAGGGDEMFAAPMDGGDQSTLPQPQQPQAPASSASSTPFPFLTQSQQQMPMGSQLILSSRRMRPEYVQYAKVAKKVDVRRLKENIWKELEFEAPSVPEAEGSRPGTATQPKTFTEVL